MIENMEEKEMTEQELLGFITKNLKTKANFLDLLSWLDKFHGSYIRLGEKTGHLNDPMRKDANIARSFIRRALFQLFLMGSLHQFNEDYEKEMK